MKFCKYNERPLQVEAREVERPERVRTHDGKDVIVPPSMMVVKNPFLGGNGIQVMKKDEFERRFAKCRNRSPTSKSTSVDKQSEED